jgi:hypothetical protein
VEGVLDIYLSSIEIRPDGEVAVLARQATILRSLGQPFVAALLEAGQRQLHRAPRTAALIRHWPGDTAAAGLAMRFNGALHALARREGSTRLATLLRHDHDDFDDAVGAAMAGGDAFIASWMRHPPQTNEVARAGAIMAALMVVAESIDMPFALLELGSSAGLNLNLAHYRYDLGGQQVGPVEAPVAIAPAWRGAPPPGGMVRITSAKGVDLRPLDVADAAARERLSSFAWTDDPVRAGLLTKAITLAQAHPPAIDRADLTRWLPRQLAMPQPEGQCRVVFHSMVLQYLDPRQRAAIVDDIRRAGERADHRRPLAWIGLEWTECRSEVRLMLTCWPDGITRHLATCHPYGEWIDWRHA